MTLSVWCGRYYVSASLSWIYKCPLVTRLQSFSTLGPPLTSQMHSSSNYVSCLPPSSLENTRQQPYGCDCLSRLSLKPGQLGLHGCWSGVARLTWNRDIMCVILAGWLYQSLCCSTTNLQHTHTLSAPQNAWNMTPMFSAVFLWPGNIIHFNV
jgi:hypothetical protein